MAAPALGPPPKPKGTPLPDLPPLIEDDELPPPPEISDLAPPPGKPKPLKLPPNIWGEIVGGLHEVIALITGWEGWRLTEEEKVTWDWQMSSVLGPLLVDLWTVRVAIFALFVITFEARKASLYRSALRAQKAMREGTTPATGGPPPPPGRPMPLGPNPTLPSGRRD